MVANLSAIGKRLTQTLVFFNALKPIISFAEALDKAIHEHDSNTTTSESLQDSFMESGQHRMPDLVETTKNNLTRSASSVTPSKSEDGFFERGKNKVYASVAEMKRSKVVSPP